MKTLQLFFVLLLFSLFAFQQLAKADTIYYHLPQPPQHLCVDTNNFPTFIIYKPDYFGVTTWYINNTNYGTGDSIVFIPTVIGSYDVVAIWNGNGEAIILRLYSQPPAHVQQFQVLSQGGYINGTNDTIWMCENSITISSNVDWNESTSMLWTGPGFTSNTSPVTLTTPGMYVYERSNPCGITRDTFQLVKLPISLPVWTDTAFCNAPVQLTLDAGPGWFTYQWNTGANTQTLEVTTAGTYAVTVSNVCATVSRSIYVDHQNYPLPDLNQYSTNIGVLLCPGQSALLRPHDSFVYDTYAWYNGNDPNNYFSDAPSVTVWSEGEYIVHVTKGMCHEVDVVYVVYKPTPFAPIHCVSSYDIQTGKNKTVLRVDAWEPLDMIGYLLAYKVGSNWFPVDTVLLSGLPQGTYTLYDYVNNPNQQSVIYGLFGINTCPGHWSSLTDWHKTIKIGIFQDVVTQEYVLQVMDPYMTYSGYIPDSYTIWVDSLNNGNLAQVGVLFGGSNSYTLENPISGASYYASVNLPWNCDMKDNNVSLSNKKTFIISEIPPLPLEQSLSIYPNPSEDGIFHLKAPVAFVEILDPMGRVVASFTNTSHLDLSEYASGVYIARIRTQGATGQVKLIKK